MSRAKLAFESLLSHHDVSRAFEPDAIERILIAVRDHLDMDVAFTSKVANGTVVIQHAQSRGASLVHVGDRFDAEESYCQRVIDGRLPYLISDTANVPETARIAATRTLPIGAHVSVPLKFSDGTVHGTFCAFSRSPNPSLNQRDLNMLQAFADIAAGQIEAETERSNRRDEILTRIREIVDRGQLTIVLQPIFALSDGSLLGVEALARFPDHDSRPASDWFEEARQIGSGRALELAAVRSAIKSLSYIPRQLFLAVNVSPDTMLDPELADELAQAGDRRIVLEVTEHDAVADYDALKIALAPLRPHVEIAVDDAGAGYSGLRHILDLRPEMIKLDMALTRGVDRDPARSALVAAMVSFAHAMDCRIIAEGVETKAEHEALRCLGVDAAQGHFLQRPLPVAAAANLFATSGLR